MQQPRHAPATEADPQVLVDELGDQLEGPQGKGEFPLPGCVPGQGAIEPLDGPGIELGLAPAAFAGLQCRPASGTVQGQPVEQGGTGYTQALPDFLDGNTCLYLGNRLAPGLGELPMRQSA